MACVGDIMQMHVGVAAMEVIGHFINRNFSFQRLRIVKRG